MRGGEEVEGTQEGNTLLMVKEERGRNEAGYAEKRKEEQRGGGTR